MKLEITFEGLCAYLFSKNGELEANFDYVDTMTVVMLHEAMVGGNKVRHTPILSVDQKYIGASGTGILKLLLERDWKLTTNGPDLTVVSGKRGPQDKSPQTSDDAKDIAWIANMEKCTGGAQVREECLGDPYADAHLKNVIQTRFVVNTGQVSALTGSGFGPFLGSHGVYDFKIPATNTLITSQFLAEGVKVTLDASDASISADQEGVELALTPAGDDLVRIQIGNRPEPGHLFFSAEHWAAFYDITNLSSLAQNDRVRPQPQPSPDIKFNMAGNRCPGVTGP